MTPPIGPHAPLSPRDPDELYCIAINCRVWDGYRCSLKRDPDDCARGYEERLEGEKDRRDGI